MITVYVSIVIFIEVVFGLEWMMGGGVGSIIIIFVIVVVDVVSGIVAFASVCVIVDIYQ